MDEYGSSKKTRAIARLENIGGDAFSVEKRAQRFDSREALNRAWLAGSI
jgi:uncharacterized protein involved in tellurium resistance